MDTYDNSLWHQLWGQSEAQDGQNPLAAAIAPPGFYAAPEASKESPDAFAAQNPGSIRSQLQNRLQSALGWIDNLAPKTAADAGEMAAYATPGLGQYLSTKDLVKAGSSGDRCRIRQPASGRDRGPGRVSVSSQSQGWHAKPSSRRKPVR